MFYIMNDIMYPNMLISNLTKGYSTHAAIVAVFMSLEYHSSLTYFSFWCFWSIPSFRMFVAFKSFHLMHFTLCSLVIRLMLHIFEFPDLLVIHNCLIIGFDVAVEAYEGKQSGYWLIVPQGPLGNWEEVDIY